MKNNKGMSLLEVTVAGGMMMMLGLASMKLAENNAKTQKKMNFNSQLSQLEFGTNIQLRKGDSSLFDTGSALISTEYCVLDTMCFVLCNKTKYRFGF